MPDDARPLVAVHIPAALADQLGGPGPDLDRQAAEALAIRAYQAGTLTAYELRQTLGIETRDALDGFLKARGVYEPVTLAGIQRDRADLAAHEAKRAAAGQALATEFRQIRRGQTLGGLRIRDLVDEGRR